MNLVELTDTIIKKIVADSESVSVKEFASDNEEVILIEVMIPNSEMPKVIGKDGSVINAIRTIVQASAHLEGNKKVNINISAY